MRRYIIHVDMDAFFAAVEQRDDPALRGRPVVVGADPKGGSGRGVVSAASYEARKFGVRSAMPISAAYRKCPHAAYLPVDMKKYAEASRRIYEVFYEFTPDVEPVGGDEAFLDVTGCLRAPRETCLALKRRILEATGLTASVGLAPTKMAAKIASDLEKPDGLVEVTPEGLVAFLRPLDISKLWGVGSKSEAALRGMGVNTIGDLARKDVRELAGAFGKTGAHLWSLARGVDERRVGPGGEAKSIGREVTFERDTADGQKIRSALLGLSEKVSIRMRREGSKGRTLTLKIRLRGFKTYTRAVTFRRPTNFADVLYNAAEKLYNVFDTKGMKVRLVGISLSKLSPADARTDFFFDAADVKRESVHKALDRIKGKFGDAMIKRAGSAAD